MKAAFLPQIMKTVGESDAPTWIFVLWYLFPRNNRNTSPHGINFYLPIPGNNEFFAVFGELKG
jgi:hypothetical protein